MLSYNDHKDLLKRVDALGREIERLRRDLLRDLAAKTGKGKTKPSLFGSVRGKDVPEEMVESAKQALFRDLEDL
ncbi:MAG: hypothetical protein AB1507_04380 [Bacillota bacterium]|jgi:hypothetical protein|nr:hypothetical protein [Thermoanaerobacteraceae bacterium]